MHVFPKLDSKALLSPMSGVTDVAFRALARKYGAGLTFTEFINCNALSRSSSKSLEMIKTDSSERPVGAQLFGNDENELIKAAKIIEPFFDIIDLNFGCPARKIVKLGSGSEMLRNPDRMEILVRKIVRSVEKPVTVKIRIGVNSNSVNALDVAKKMENAGVAAISIHGRTQKQGYSGESDWGIIKKIKESANIPIIGNGDVNTPEIFRQRLEESNVDAILIGRGAIGNPYIFHQINDYLRENRYDNMSKSKMFLEYLKLAKKHNISFLSIRGHAIQFTKGLEGGSLLRTKIMQIKDLGLLEKFFQNLTC